MPQPLFTIQGFFRNILRNIASLYKGTNLLWQIGFVIVTVIFVGAGLDWHIFQISRGMTLQSLAFPAVVLGSLLPIVIPIAMLAYGLLTKNKKAITVTYALGQAALLGVGISSFYKVFTGRSGPPETFVTTNTSTMFHFGFYRGGAFEGWPSSHTSVAFATSIALVMLYPDNKYIKYLAPLYALYIGLGVSITIHWFSDFIAGAILGTMIGIAVGKSFLE
jgi:membrane-associated phospholipid phosphatase